MPKASDIPPFPGVPAARSPGGVTKDYEIHLVTPMFGGGVTAGEPDHTLPIRGTSIRGQLEFWWRATRGRLLSTDAMWRRQEEVFGSTEFPSPLELAVQWVEGFQRVNPGQAFDRFGPGAYALFPAIENRQEIAREGLKFGLSVRWPTPDRLREMRALQNRSRQQNRRSVLPSLIDDITPEVEAAVWAWLTFGGLGARTRRGVGAVHATPLPALGPARPALNARIFIGRAQGTAMEAWQAAVTVYRDFRQTPRGQRHQKTIKTKQGPRAIKVPGRSHWPEADSIRHITRCSLKTNATNANSAVSNDENTHDHSKPVVPAAAIPAFPKAVMGLPINFHFSDGPEKNAPGCPNKDPQDVQLVPLVRKRPDGPAEPADRMASPVITRPLYLGNRWYPGIVIFRAPHLDHLEARLVGNRSMSDGTDISRDIQHRQVADRALAILEPLRGHPSAIDAFMDYLKDANFEERCL